MKKLLLSILIVIFISNISFAAITDNLWEYHSFDDGNCNDDSGNDKNCTFIGVPSNSTGFIGNAMSCDGADDGIRSQWKYKRDEMTICYWHKSSASSLQFSGFQDDSGTTQALNLLVFTANAFFANDRVSETNNLVGGTTAINTNNWVWLCYVRNTTHQTIFYNGTQEGTNTNLQAEFNSAYPMDWCGLNDNGIHTNDWAVEVDEIAIWNRSLSKTEIKTTFDNYLINITPIEPEDNNSPTLSNYNYTASNIVSGENSSVWNTNGTINITSNVATLTATANKDANCSMRIDVEGNYSSYIAFSENTKFATTDTTSQSGTLFENISLGNHCLYISCIDSNLNEPNASQSTSGCLNITYNPISFSYGTGQADDYFFNFTNVSFAGNTPVINQINVSVWNITDFLYNITNYDSISWNLTMKINATFTKHNLTCLGNNTIILNTSFQTIFNDVPAGNSSLLNCTADYLNASIGEDFEVTFNVSHN